MAGTSLLTLLDDIAAVLDDIAVMSKVAAKKTTSVLGDDLAVSAEQVGGIRAARELPVIWAIAKGSFRNKFFILVPVAIAISAFAPWLITPLLMLGGTYLCLEGFEKIAHKLSHKNSGATAEHRRELEALVDPQVDIVKFEEGKIKGAIRTDLVLSAEVVVIALGTVKDSPLWTQISVVAVIAILMTIGVYAVVAGIVKIDDVGLYLLKAEQADRWHLLKQKTGGFLLKLAPRMMKMLSVVGTIAMFMVGGGILMHGIPGVHDILHHAETSLEHIPIVGHVLSYIIKPVSDVVAGVIAGALAFGVLTLGGAILRFMKGAQKEA